MTPLETYHLPLFEPSCSSVLVNTAQLRHVRRKAFELAETFDEQQSTLFFGLHELHFDVRQ